MLSIKSPTGGNDGIFISEVSIKDCSIAYNTIPYPTAKYSHDIVLTLSLNVPGLSFEPTMTISGNFKRDEFGAVTDWGQAFLVSDFFSRLGIMGDINPDNTIPEAWIQQLPGMRFLRLSYTNGWNSKKGKPRYKDWNQIASLQDGVVSLRNRFLAAVENRRVKDYTPNPKASQGSEHADTDPTAPFHA